MNARTYDDWLKLMKVYGVPTHMRDGLANYITHGRHVGHFLTAVLSNDLREAVSRADDENVVALASYVRFLTAHAPILSWMSAESVENWMKIGGLEGYVEKTKP